MAIMLEVCADDRNALRLYQDFNEPTEIELAIINGEKMCDACINDAIAEELKSASIRRPGETITTVVSRANAILRKYGVEACMEWCSQCQKPTDHYADRSDSYRCAICD